MKTARLFNCGLCRTLISICSYCDRGNIYCCDDCAQYARQISLRAAGKRYQNTYQGGLNHAARQKRYVARNKALQNQDINKVTRPVAVARGNEKGRVERAIRYIRDNFFAARNWHDVDDLNKQALHWCDGVASDRPCPELTTQSVRVTFEQEKLSLIALPANPYNVCEREEVRVGKTPYVRFDLNDYSVPHTFVLRTLTVTASLDKITVLADAQVIAKHNRSYKKGVQIENEAHIQELVAIKKQASQHRGQNRLIHAIPIAVDLLKMAAERGSNMGQITMRLLQLLDDYGVVEMTAALTEAVTMQTPQPNSVRFILEQRREMRNQLPLVKLALPSDPRVRELMVRPHNLIDYDQLNTATQEIDDVK